MADMGEAGQISGSTLPSQQLALPVTLLKSDDIEIAFIADNEAPCRSGSGMDAGTLYRVFRGAVLKWPAVLTKKRNST
jgi:hypothetical protein